MSEPRLSHEFLTRVQAASGALVGVFATLHLGNALAAFGGGLLYDEVQSILRLAYRPNMIVEGVLLGAIGVHTAASLTKAARRPRPTIVALQDTSLV